LLWPKLQVGLSGSSLGVAAALAAAVFYALNLILLRKIAQNEHPATIVAFQNGGPALLLAIPAMLVWQPVSAMHWGIAIMGGVLGVTGHLLLTRAFAMATAARVATTEYSGLVWASVLGFVLFGEVPGIMTFAGAALIILGAVAISRR
jgi:drug/metabolite transporter (DMT)-like permease